MTMLLFSRRGRGAGGVRGQCGGSDPFLHRALPGGRRAAGGGPPGAQQERLPLLVPLAAAFQTLPKGIIQLFFFSLNHTVLRYQSECTYDIISSEPCSTEISHRCNQTFKDPAFHNGYGFKNRLLNSQCKSNQGPHLTAHLNENCV